MLLAPDPSLTNVVGKYTGFGSIEAYCYYSPVVLLAGRFGGGGRLHVVIDCGDSTVHDIN